MWAGFGHLRFLEHGRVLDWRSECTNMAISNLERYKKDLKLLIDEGDRLHMAIQKECFPSEVSAKLRTGRPKEKFKSLLEGLPNFRESYERWYSEAKALVKQLLPDRLVDFVAHYESPKNRKEITYATYRILDYLHGLSVTRGPYKEKVVGPDAAIPHFRQQLAIVRALEARFVSSLFDIRQLVQADLFDSDLDAADELARKKFTRAAGAMAGVVMERHLAQVCSNHALKLAKKSPTIADLNDALKQSNVIEVPDWRFIQHLADLRNLCDHNRATEPTVDQVKELIAGVRRISKSLF